jgi:hypothetical protein
MTREEFLAAYPEFVVIDNEEPSIVPAKLVAADAFVSDSWGDKRDEIIGLEAAHLLAISPFGRNAKLESSLGKSTYGEQLKQRKRAHACALNRQG